MNEHSKRPNGLNQRQMTRLEEHVHRGHLLDPQRLLQVAYAHLEDVQGAQANRPEIDVKMAEAICHVLDRVVSEWDSFSPTEQSWLRGAMWYFSKCHDEKPDLQVDGFRDDVEVLNACLRLAHREQWLLSLDAD